MSEQHELLDVAIRKVGNRYLATMLVAKRTRQLHHGAQALVERAEGESHFTVAMREIAAGYVVMNSDFAASAALPSTLATPNGKNATSAAPPPEAASEDSPPDATSTEPTPDSP